MKNTLSLFKFFKKCDCRNAIVFSLLFLLSGVANAQMKVSGKNLYDVNGEKFIARGLEQTFGINHGEDGSYLDEMAKSGANAVRILPNSNPNQLTLAQVDNLILKAKNLGMVVYLSPGPEIPAGGDKNLECWKWYERDDVYNMLQKHRDYLILDAVQEHTDPTAEDWARTCKTGIDRLRKKGYTNPLLMMANNYGRNANTVIAKAAEIFNYDPQKNTFFNVQAYWNDCLWNWCADAGQLGKGTSTEIIRSNIAKLAALDYCVQIGVCPWAEGAGCDQGNVDYKAAMEECQRYGMGWLVWDWYNPYEWSHVFSVTRQGGIYGNWVNLCTTPEVDDCRDSGQYGCDYGYQVVVGHAASIQKTSVKTCYFKGNVNCGTTNPPTTTLRNPENPASTVASVEYKYYEGSWSVLPNFDAMTATKSGNVSNFDMTPRNRTDNYGFKYSGFVSVPTDGTYTFYTSSDDGSKLYIGTTEVVNNDGLHGMQEKSGTIGLKAGKHAISVTFFEATGGEGLTVSYAGPGITKQAIPNSALSRSGSTPPPSGFSGTYKITARHSSKALDVTNSSTADGGNVQQWVDNGTAAQQWIITATTDGHYRLVSKATGKALEVANNSLADGGNVQQWSYVGSNSQQWKIEATTDGYYRLLNRNSGKALDVAGILTSDGANVHQWTYVGGNNQQWKLDLLSTSTTRLGEEGVALADVMVYPNPAKGTVNLKIHSEVAQQVKLSLTNAQGRQVISQVKGLQAGENTVSVAVDQLAAGLYFVKIQKGAKQVVQKVVISQ